MSDKIQGGFNNIPEGIKKTSRITKVIGIQVSPLDYYIMKVMTGMTQKIQKSVKLKNSEKYTKKEKLSSACLSYRMYYIYYAVYRTFRENSAREKEIAREGNKTPSNAHTPCVRVMIETYITPANYLDRRGRCARKENTVLVGTFISVIYIIPKSVRQYPYCGWLIDE